MCYAQDDEVEICLGCDNFHIRWDTSQAPVCDWKTRRQFRARFPLNGCPYIDHNAPGLLYEGGPCSIAHNWSYETRDRCKIKKVIEPCHGHQCCRRHILTTLKDRDDVFREYERRLLDHSYTKNDEASARSLGKWTEKLNSAKRHHREKCGFVLRETAPLDSTTSG